jgi:NIMA (never in mitosis gene a)-related kinase
MMEMHSRYVKVRRLGRGGFGTATLVRQRDTGVLYVRKKIPMEGTSIESAIKESDFLASFDHPNIIRYIESYERPRKKGNQSGAFYIVMEYADGGDLTAKFPTGRKLSESEVLLIFGQIAMALAYLHSRRILHRDLKPANIFLMKNGTVKLGDFGIARVVGVNELATTQIGTPEFLAPEVWAGRPYNSKADIWSLGCLLYSLCTFKSAFGVHGNRPTREVLRRIEARIRRGQIEELPNKYSKDLTSLVKRMLSQNPTERPEVRQILGLRFMKNSLRQAAVKTPQPAEPKPLDRNQPTKQTPDPTPHQQEQPQQLDFSPRHKEQAPQLDLSPRHKEQAPQLDFSPRRKEQAPQLGRSPRHRLQAPQPEMSPSDKAQSKRRRASPPHRDLPKHDDAKLVDNRRDNPAPARRHKMEKKGPVAEFRRGACDDPRRLPKVNPPEPAKHLKPQDAIRRRADREPADAQLGAWLEQELGHRLDRADRRPRGEKRPAGPVVTPANSGDDAAVVIRKLPGQRIPPLETDRPPLPDDEARPQWDKAPPKPDQVPSKPDQVPPKPDQALPKPHEPDYDAPWRPPGRPPSNAYVPVFAPLPLLATPLERRPSPRFDEPALPPFDEPAPPPVYEPPPRRADGQLPIVHDPAPPIVDNSRPPFAQTPLPIGGGYPRPPLRRPLPVIEMIPVPPFQDAMSVAESGDRDRPKLLPEEPAQRKPEVGVTQNQRSTVNEGGTPGLSPQLYASIWWALGLADVADDAPAEPAWDDVENRGDY